MGIEVTKSDTIRSYLALGCSAREIAAIVGCEPAYVRAVRNRTRNTAERGTCQYANEIARHRERWKTDPAYRERTVRCDRAYKARNREKINENERWRRLTDIEYRDRRRAHQRAYRARLKAGAQT